MDVVVFCCCFSLRGKAESLANFFYKVLLQSVAIWSWSVVKKRAWKWQLRAEKNTPKRGGTHAQRLRRCSGLIPGPLETSGSYAASIIVWWNKANFSRLGSEMILWNLEDLEITEPKTWTWSSLCPPGLWSLQLQVPSRAVSWPCRAQTHAISCHPTWLYAGKWLQCPEQFGRISYQVNSFLF